MVHGPRRHRILPGDQLPSGSRIPPLRKPLRRGSQMAWLSPRWDQFLCIKFAQLSYRESLRDIAAMHAFARR